MSESIPGPISESTEPISDEGVEIEKQIQALLTEATEREHTVRRRAFYVMVIPAALALILLMGTGLQIRRANQAVSNYRVELDDTEKELVSIKLQMDNTNEALSAANQELMIAKEALTETLVTLELVTEDLIVTQDKLALTELNYEGLKIEYDTLQERLKRYNEEILDLKQQIDELQQSLDSVDAELRAAIDKNLYRFEGEWMLMVNYIAERYPAAGKLLQTIIELQDARFVRGGFSPDNGFDSPSFATFVLQVNGVIGEEGADYRYSLREVLPNRFEGPRVGDIVFYQGGYTMFYFVDESGLPFVIGMTTQGVAALSPEFAPILAYGATEF